MAKPNPRNMIPEAQLRVYFDHEDIGAVSPALCRDGGSRSLEPRPPQWNAELYQVFGDDGPLLMQIVLERLHWCQGAIPGCPTPIGDIFPVLRAEYAQLSPRNRLRPKQDAAREAGGRRIQAAKALYAVSCDHVPFPERRERQLVKQTEALPGATGAPPPKGRKQLLRWMRRELMGPLHQAGYL